MAADQNNRKTTYLASAGLLLVAFIWGVAFVVVKSALDYIPPIWMLALRFTLATVLMLLIFRNRIVTAVRGGRTIIKHGFYLGIFLYVAYATQTIGCMYTPAGKNAFITATYVVLVPFFHWFRTRKRPNHLCFIAAFIAIIAIGLISLNGDLTMNIGDFLTLICGIVYALQIEYLDKYTENEDPIVLSVFMIGFAAVLSWVSAPLMDGPMSGIVFNHEMLMGILYLGVLSTMVCFMLQSLCQKYLRSSTAAIIMCMESVFGALASAVFLGERMTGRAIFGCFLMLAAVILAQVDFEELFGERKKFADI